MSGGHSATATEAIARHIQSGFFQPAVEHDAAPSHDETAPEAPFGFFPVWDLRTKAASILRCEPRGAKGTNAAIEIEMLHGAAELQREANGLTILPFLRPLHDESVTRLHAALGEEETARVWTLGRNAPLDKLVHEALGREVAAID